MQKSKLYRHMKNTEVFNMKDWISNFKDVDVDVTEEKNDALTMIVYQFPIKTFLPYVENCI